mmetsp:Transcript_9060/g.25532  ORF Transcript_9060/g.25532 Transcript_9060/m.25532 type:complete len:270 (-) Transcript_9060:60-869(-)
MKGSAHRSAAGTSRLCSGAFWDEEALAALALVLLVRPGEKEGLVRTPSSLDSSIGLGLRACSCCSCCRCGSDTAPMPAPAIIGAPFFFEADASPSDMTVSAAAPLLLALLLPPPPPLLLPEAAAAFRSSWMVRSASLNEWLASSIRAASAWLMDSLIWAGVAPPPAAAAVLPALPWLPPPVDRAAVTAVPLVAGVSSIMGAAPAVAVAADIYFFSPGRIWKIGLPGSRIDFFQCFCSAFAICKVFGQRTRSCQGAQQGWIDEQCSKQHN